MYYFSFCYLVESWLRVTPCEYWRQKDPDKRLLVIYTWNKAGPRQQASPHPPTLFFSFCLPSLSAQFWSIAINRKNKKHFKQSCTNLHHPNTNQRGLHNKLRQKNRWRLGCCFEFAPIILHFLVKRRCLLFSFIIWPHHSGKIMLIYGLNCLFQYVRPISDCTSWQSFWLMYHKWLN